MAALLLRGANIRFYINGTQYKPVESISFTVDYGETEIYGIDSPYPQEIAGTKVTIRGNVNGLRLKFSGGLQAANARPLYSDFQASPYISLRINDRDSNEDILFIPYAKITRESHSIPNRGTYKLNFEFLGQVPLFSADRISSSGSSPFASIGTAISKIF